MLKRLQCSLQFAVLVFHYHVVILRAIESTGQERFKHTTDIFIAKTVDFDIANILALSFGFNGILESCIVLPTCKIVRISFGLDTVDGIFHLLFELLYYPFGLPFTFYLIALHPFGCYKSSKKRIHMIGIIIL